jgi:hypothetical protein
MTVAGYLNRGALKNVNASASYENPEEMMPVLQLVLVLPVAQVPLKFLHNLASPPKALSHELKSL